MACASQQGRVAIGSSLVRKKPHVPVTLIRAPKAPNCPTPKAPNCPTHFHASEEIMQHSGAMEQAAWIVKDQAANRRSRTLLRVQTRPIMASLRVLETQHPNRASRCTPWGEAAPPVSLSLHSILCLLTQRQLLGCQRLCSSCGQAPVLVCLHTNHGQAIACDCRTCACSCLAVSPAPAPTAPSLPPEEQEEDGVGPLKLGHSAKQPRSPSPTLPALRWSLYPPTCAALVPTPHYVCPQLWGRTSLPPTCASAALSALLQAAFSEPNNLTCFSVSDSALLCPAFGYAPGAEGTTCSLAAVHPQQCVRSSPCRQSRCGQNCCVCFNLCRS
jgi:hypothetical protein